MTFQLQLKSNSRFQDKLQQSIGFDLNVDWSMVKIGTKIFTLQPFYVVLRSNHQWMFAVLSIHSLKPVYFISLKLVHLTKRSCKANKCQIEPSFVTSSIIKHVDSIRIFICYSLFFCPKRLILRKKTIFKVIYVNCALLFGQINSRLLTGKERKTFTLI